MSVRAYPIIPVAGIAIATAVTTGMAVPLVEAKGFQPGWTTEILLTATPVVLWLALWLLGLQWWRRHVSPYGRLDKLLILASAVIASSAFAFLPFDLALGEIGAGDSRSSFFPLIVLAIACLAVGLVLGAVFHRKLFNGRSRRN